MIHDKQHIRQSCLSNRPPNQSRVIDRRHFLGSAGIAGLLLPAHADSPTPTWPDERSLGPFRYHADYSLESDSRLLKHIAGMHQQLPTELGFKPNDNAIHVYLFSRQATYERYLARFFTNVPQRRALFIKQGGPGMVFAYRSRDFATDVRHETTHAVLHNSLPTVPLWMDEGLAEYYEVARDDRRLKNPHLRKVIREANRHRLPSLSRLESITELGEMTAVEYREAFAWMHFCLHGPVAARKILQSHLLDISQNRPAGRFADRVRKSMPDVEYQFFSHYRRLA